MSKNEKNSFLSGLYDLLILIMTVFNTIICITEILDISVGYRIKRVIYQILDYLYLNLML
jgi:hypothetical protein